MQTLGLTNGTETRPAFFERMFISVPGHGPRRFDWTFGVVLPIICIAADPIVFRSSLGISRVLFLQYKTFAYAISAVSILAMVAWLLWGDRLGELRGYFCGLFLAASAVSFVAGVVLLPYSLLGMIVVIGILGFTPFLSSLVFLRNAAAIYHTSTDNYPKAEVLRATVLGALYGIVVPFVLQSVFH